MDHFSAMLRLEAVSVLGSELASGAFGGTDGVTCKFFVDLRSASFSAQDLQF